METVGARDRGRGTSCGLTDLGARTAADASWKISVVVTVCRLIKGGSYDASLISSTAWVILLVGGLGGGTEGVIARGG